jgi:excinuclease ABC subunit B
MYADRMTGSMTAAIEETERRREKQIAYNRAHGIEPTTVVKAIREIGIRLAQVADVEERYEKGGRPIAAGQLPKDELMRLIKDLESQMKQAARDLEFEKAAALRDEVVDLRGLLVLESGPDSLEASAEPVRTTKRVQRAGFRPPGRSGRRR